VNCSSFESLVEHYFDGTLLPKERTDFALHLDRCNDCAMLFEEVRVVDALLLTPRKLDTAPNFTFKIMAEIGSLPQPVVAKPQIARWLVGYLAASWLAVSVACITAGSQVREALHGVLLFAVRSGAGVATFAQDMLVSSHADAAKISEVAGGVLLFDAGFAALVVAFSFLRPRFAMRVSSSKSGSCDLS